MENFKLKNLRELSTEEQLQINGGSFSQGCTCTVKCICKGELKDKKSADDDAHAYYATVQLQGE